MYRLTKWSLFQGEYTKMARCTGRNQVCRRCDYRYAAGDKSWECPNCKEDRRCKRNPIDGFPVCGRHGAGFPKSRGKQGGRPPVHGRRSKILSTRLAHAYKEILGDTNLLEIMEDIALITTLRDETVQELEDGISPSMWKNAKRLLSEFEDALAGGNKELAIRRKEQLRKMLDSGHNMMKVRSNVIDMTEKRIKAVQTERKYRIDNEYMITVEQQLLNINETLQIIKECVKDPATINMIQYKFRLMIDRDNTSKQKQLEEREIVLLNEGHQYGSEGKQ